MSMSSQKQQYAFKIYNCRQDDHNHKSPAKLWMVSVNVSLEVTEEGRRKWWLLTKCFREPHCLINSSIFLIKYLFKRYIVLSDFIEFQVWCTKNRTDDLWNWSTKLRSRNIWINEELAQLCDMHVAIGLFQLISMFPSLGILCMT